MKQLSFFSIFIFITPLFFTCVSWADKYAISINSENLRLINVIATITPDGNEVGMNEHNEHDLINGWATYVQNVRAFSSDGSELEIKAKKNSRWELPAFQSGTITLFYQVKLAHDQLIPAIKAGDNGAAYVNPDGVMWAGRALFIAGKPSKNITVEFSLPLTWSVTTQWQDVPKVPFTFVAENTENLLNSAFFAGTHHFTQLTVEGITLRIALSGLYSEQMVEKVKKQVASYFNYYGQKFKSAMKTQLVLILADRFYTGGEVMGKAISITLSPDIKKDMNAKHGMVNRTSRLVAHELFHSFSFNQLEVDDTGENVNSFEWFNEGFGAEYGAFTSLIRTGVYTESEFFSSIILRLKYYQEEIDGKLTLKTASNDKHKYSSTVYWGGLIAALSLDFLIRDHSDGQQSLDDLWVYLLENHPKHGDALTLQKLYKAAYKLYGKNIALALKHYVNTTEPIPFIENAKLMGLTYNGEVLMKSKDASARQKTLWAGFKQINFDNIPAKNMKAVNR